MANIKTNSKKVTAVTAVTPEIAPIISLDSLIDKVVQIAERSNTIASTKLGEIESSINDLIGGSLTSAELVNRYGALSPLERDQQIHELEQVKNAIAVQIEKERVNQKAILLQEQKATTVFTGLKAAFNMQAMAEKTMDAKQESEYQGEKRLLNQADRQNELDYKSQRNELVKEDQANKIDHVTEVNKINSTIREAVRSRLNAIATRKIAQATRETVS